MSEKINRLFHYDCIVIGVGFASLALAEGETSPPYLEEYEKF